MCERAGATCFSNYDPCCSGVCDGGLCTCVGNGGTCSVPSDCCSGLCGADARCACAADFGGCVTDTDCCSGTCTNTYAGGYCSSCKASTPPTYLQLSGLCVGFPPNYPYNTSWEGCMSPDPAPT